MLAVVVGGGGSGDGGDGGGRGRPELVKFKPRPSTQRDVSNHRCGVVGAVAVPPYSPGVVAAPSPNAPISANSRNIG